MRRANVRKATSGPRGSPEVAFPTFGSIRSAGDAAQRGRGLDGGGQVDQRTAVRGRELRAVVVEGGAVDVVGVLEVQPRESTCTAKNPASTERRSATARSGARWPR
jgi:hypothetical protein